MERTLFVLAIAVVLTACGAQATGPSVGPTSSTTPQPAVETPTPTSTSTDQSPAAAPTPTPRPTAVPTARPTAHPTPPPTAPATPPPTAPPTNMAAAVSAMNFAFSPSSLSVHVGTRVTFTNRDAATHTFTANGGLFDSGDVASGQSYGFTFTQAGSYAYHCRIHSSMTGTITVSR
jgi:plastocyanin